MKWYYMAGPGGTIACKGSFPGEAKQEAAERWKCDASEIRITDEEPYNTGLGGRYEQEIR